jgi:hypothetical protein
MTSSTAAATVRRGMGKRSAPTAPPDLAPELRLPHAPQWGNTPASAQLCVKRARSIDAARTVAAADVAGWGG